MSSTLIDAPPINTPTPPPAPEPKATQGTPGESATETAKEVKAKAEVIPAAKEEPKYYERKVNGVMRKYTVEELLNKVGMSDAAMEKFQQASEKEKRSDAMREGLKKDFLKTLQDPELGLSREEIRNQFEVWYKENFIDTETMTEDQKELRKLKALAKEREEKDKAAAERLEKENEEKTDAHTRTQLQEEIVKGLEGSGLPKTRYTVSRMAYWMKQNLARGFDAPMDIVIQQVKDEEAGIFTQNLASRSVEQIIAMSGGDVFVDKVRKYDLERLKKKFGGEAPAGKVPRETKERGSIPMSQVDEYFNNLRRSKR